MKKIINISLMLLVCLTLVTGCGKNNNIDNKDNNKDNDSKNNNSTVEVNNNQEVIKNQNIDGIEITNVSLVYEDGISYFKATATNNTGSDYVLNQYKIYVKDQDGNIITTMLGNIGNTLKNGESKTIRTMISENLSNAYSIDFEVVK